MFKSTNHFFEKVATGNVANLDIKRYVNLITENHKLENLKTLEYDISFFIFILSEDLQAEIKDEDWQKKFEYYKQKGEKMPFYKVPNLDYIINKKKGLPYENIPEFVESFDTEKIFYPHALFSIRQLENYVKKLISEKNEPSDPKHENIFCNNGFVLFEYLQENFVMPKNERGHHKDVLFCYHKLFNSKPKYIHQKIQTFLDWYNPLYVDEINQTKTYDEVKTIKREKLYSTTLDLFKHQK